jgi:tetratricopeptide (TPR) repeat protein
MSRLGVIALLALGAPALGSCFFSHSYNCENHEKALQARDMGKIAYSGGNFGLAKTNYKNACEWCTDNYESRIGLAHASRGYGNERFKNADDFAGIGKLQQAQKLFNEARDEDHQLAFEIFYTLIKERGDDLEPHFGLGLLLYERSTSPIPAPWQPGDAVNRQRERDECIREFSHVISRLEDTQKRSSQAYRYRGLAYLAADNVEEGARDLEIYHDSRQDLYNQIVRQWPALTPEEKKRKSDALGNVEKEINDVREVIILELAEAVRRSAELKKKEAKTPAEAQQITQGIAHLSSQQIVLEGMVKSWSLTKLGDIEQVVVKRCREYLDTFNRGKLNEILPFLGARKGEEGQLRQSVSSKVERETKFNKVVFRTVVVDQETASVGFICDLATKQGTASESKVTIRWRLVGGQWLVADHP